MSKMKHIQPSPLYKIRGNAPGKLHAMRKDIQFVAYLEVKLVISGTWLKPWEIYPAPKFPPDHIFSILAEQFQQAIQDKEMDELEDLLEQYQLFGRTCTNYLKYDHTKIRDLLKNTQKLTTSFTHSSPTPIAQQLQQYHQPQTIGLKTPRMETPTWNCDPYSFYFWLSSCSKPFVQSNCNSIAKTQFVLQAMPLDKKSAFVNIDSWEEFKSKLINQFEN